mmetsp:Transcript_6664/g.8890  ORF Transcript_6664/g.8890 Transcript_6664/m.8890 type:complete len:326 (+) Transcript_6664:61-1038(+)
MWVDDIVQGADLKEDPWIILTAGVMGAGKSHTIHWMSRNGYFPLPDIVQIDPDVFRTRFPEWEGYVAANAETAGNLTRREAGYLVEIAQWATLGLSKNVWVDGSLRDGEWYRGVIRDIKKEYMQYRLAIIYVNADLEAILKRIESRAVETGRKVPLSDVVDSMERVPKSIKLLKEEVDFLAEVDNTVSPSLSRYCDTQSCYLGDCSFDQLRLRFATHPDIVQKTPEFLEQVERLIQQNKLVVFAKSYCSYSHSIINLFRELKVPFQQYELDQMEGGMGMQLELYAKTKLHTVPLVFLDGEFLGNCGTIVELHESEKLLPLLQAKL